MARSVALGFNSAMSSAQPSPTSEYRLAPPVMARFVGAYLMVLAIVLLATTAAASTLDWNLDVLVVVLGLGLLGLIALAWWMRSKLVVLQLTVTGYRTRMIRAAGVTEARWSEVEDEIATTPRGIECIVLRLRDGRTTTIPVQLIAADKDDLARDIRGCLERAAR